MGEKAYWVTAMATAETNSVEAHLFRLRQQLYIDTLHTNRSLDYVPAHQVSKITHVEQSLETADLNYDWLAKLLDKHPAELRHIVLQDKPGERPVVASS